MFLIFLFWALVLDDNSWVELPVISPKQLRQSRLIRHVFSGELESKVFTSPTFDGQEKHLLKCQIVRISFCTLIQLKGKEKLTESEEENSKSFPSMPNNSKK
jgi:radial spoke head protein 4/6